MQKKICIGISWISLEFMQKIVHSNKLFQFNIAIWENRQFTLFVSIYAIQKFLCLSKIVIKLSTNEK